MRAPTSGVFFDGMTSARHVVSVDLEKANLMIRGVAEPFVRTRWPYGELEQLPAPEGVLYTPRVTQTRTPVHSPSNCFLPSRSRVPDNGSTVETPAGSICTTRTAWPPIPRRLTRATKGQARRTARR